MIENSIITGVKQLKEILIIKDSRVCEVIKYYPNSGFFNVKKLCPDCKQLNNLKAIKPTEKFWKMVFNEKIVVFSKKDNLRLDYTTGYYFSLIYGSKTESDLYYLVFQKFTYGQRSYNVMRLRKQGKDFVIDKEVFEFTQVIND